jgi:hypothetical protein
MGEGRVSATGERKEEAAKLLVDTLAGSMRRDNRGKREEEKAKGREGM